ncbi:DUF6452 family protein [Winogradskyella psychrotolerans]|uniref:DUF6452 family protein n=1 Tax=Winogradskyella psychrotolerans TaxID=1344585 RepID=UPI001C07332C|nr:DUF6452 family protein [Winogradskyella psychrotolerans]MBU2927260.1 hypothetical protein [Winogradskyella psychrotolerans]
MKRLLIFISFITLAIINFNCERDDICAATTQTTPRLIVGFYDATDTDELLNVSRITVYGDGLFTDEDGVTTEPIEESDLIIIDYDDEDSYVFNINSNTIALPLIVGGEGELLTTRFVLEKDTDLRLDDDDDTSSNIDIIEISYNTEFVYVSRACGYKSNFNSLGVARITDDDQWITNIEIEETTQESIANENTTHVRIYH